MNFKRSLAATSVAAAVTSMAFVGLPAQAASPKIDVYLSAPQVEGTYVTGSGVYLADFNTSCNFPMGTLAASCVTENAGMYGGAETSTATAVTSSGGTGTPYVTGSTQSIDLTMTTPARYVGFWWSAGSANDTVTFYKNNVELIQITTADVLTLLSNSQVTSVDDSNYDTYKYFGNPRLGSGTNTGSGHGGATPDEPFAYLHLILTGGASFDRVVLSGIGFEFDNFTTGELSPAVDGSLVSVKTENLPEASLDSPAEEELAETGASSNQMALMLALLSGLTGAGALVAARKSAE